jgi:large subunit ribosomal protein L15
MNLNNLKPAEGSVKKGKRIGRGQGSGRGGTSTKGHKGAQSRTGYSRKIGFEGGQMPLQRRVPKHGFKNPNRVEYQPLNLSRLQDVADKFGLSEINSATLTKAGIVSKNDKIKILGNGTLTAKLTVMVHAISKKAEEAIVNAGGSVETI